MAMMAMTTSNSIKVKAFEQRVIVHLKPNAQ
jgi:hypothetical protein